MSGVAILNTIEINTLGLLLSHITECEVWILLLTRLVLTVSEVKPCPLEALEDTRTGPRGPGNRAERTVLPGLVSS